MSFLNGYHLDRYSIFKRLFWNTLSKKSMVSVKVGHADLALASSFDVESMVAHPNYEKNHNRSVLLLGQIYFLTEKS